MTLAQRRILNTLQEFTEEHGYPPTVRELGALCGYTSPSTTKHHLQSLKEVGAVSWERGKVRTLRVTT